MRIRWPVVKELEVSKNQINEWLKTTPFQDLLKSTNLASNDYYVSENKSRVLKGYLKPKNDQEMERILQDNNLLGHLGEIIGKIILNQDFYLFRSSTKANHFLERLNTLFLLFTRVIALSNIEEVNIKYSNQLWRDCLKILMGDVEFTAFWKSNTLIEHGPFTFSFDKLILGSVEKQKKEHGLPLELYMHETLGLLNFEDYIRYYFPKQVDKFMELRQYLTEKEIKRKRFNNLTSFISKYTLLDVHEFIETNNAILSHELDDYGIPKDNSEFYTSNKLFAIDYKAHQINCDSHTKNLKITRKKLDLTELQKKFILEVLKTEVSVLILDIYFCECGRIFCKYLKPKI